MAAVVVTCVRHNTPWWSCMACHGSAWRQLRMGELRTKAWLARADFTPLGAGNSSAQLSCIDACVSEA